MTNIVVHSVLKTEESKSERETPRSERILSRSGTLSISMDISNKSNTDNIDSSFKEMTFDVCV